jgi:NitT/TauT family transport system substrate-binding protein
MKLTRRATLAAAALAAPFVARAQTLQTLIVAEPQHGIGYLPLYVAVAKGFFTPENLAVKILTIESGSGHINAVLSGQAFAFIGGPEHNAFAELKGAHVTAVANVVNRSNNYLVARKGVAADAREMAATLRGKTIATGFYGGTPNSTTRWVCVTAGLKMPDDVHLLETTTPGALAAVKSGQAQFAMCSEPILTQGIRAGIWDEPFWSGPKAFGPYAYSVLNVRHAAMDQDPKAVAGFVRAVMKGLKFTYDNPKAAAELARQQFPTMPIEDMQATLERCFADELWSRDGMISQEAWKNAEDVVLAAGILTAPVPYDSIIDMQFLKA